MRFFSANRIVAGLILAIFVAANGFADVTPNEASLFNVVDATRIKDQAGRLIDAGTGFTRIISLYGAHTENLFALGLNQEIIGVSPNEAHPPEALAKPVFSYHDDPESWKLWAAYGVLAVEMETAGLYTLAAKFGVEALSVLTVRDSLATGEAASSEQREKEYLRMARIALAAAA